MKKFFKYLWMAVTRRRYEASKRADFHGEHLLDETEAETGGVWMNLHGYRVDDGTLYIGADYRFLGIRLQNVIIKCNSQEAYDKWIHCAISETHLFYEHVLDECSYKRGGDVDTCFVFHTTDGDDKEYNVDQAQDLLAEA